MNPCSARFLETPHVPPAECLIEVMPAGIQIRGADGRLVWVSWDEVQSAGKAGKVWRIAGFRGEIPFALLVDEESCFREIEEGWRRALPERARQVMDPESKLFFLKIGAFVAVLLAIIAMLYFVFIHLYWVVPKTFDEKMGDLLHTTSFASQGICTDSTSQQFVRKAQLALHLRSDQFKHPIQIIPDTVVNAFAIPGGRIYLHRGLILRSESPDEILGVLAHEMAHSELRHGTRQIWQGMGLALVLSMTFDPGAILEIANQLARLKYSRNFETEADQQAMERMQNAGLDPTHLERLLKRIEPAGSDSMLDFLSSHPMGENRFRSLRDSKSNARVAADTLFQAERHSWKTIRDGICK